MIQATISKLHEMRLYAMADKAVQLNASPQASSLGPLEALSFCVDAEYDKRRSSRLGRLLKDARIKHSTACVEDINYHAKRNISKDALADIISGGALDAKSNILICGPTGVGKSYLACAIANLACRKGLSTRYFRVSRLLEYFAAQRAQGNYVRTIERLGALKMLVLDDLGPDVMSAEQRNAIMELTEERYMVWPTIITSQLPFEQWYDVFGDHSIADAICDRIFHNARKLELTGESMRKQ